MKTKLLFYCLIVLLPTFVFAKSFYESYLEGISQHCPDANSLAIKKSAIQMLSNSGSNCDDMFSKGLIDACSVRGLNCNELKKIFLHAKNETSGNVVGR